MYICVASIYDYNFLGPLNDALLHSSSYETKEEFQRTENQTCDHDGGGNDYTDFWNDETTKCGAVGNR